MKVSLLIQTPMQLPSYFRQFPKRFFLFLAMIVSANSLIWAEGSKDFVTYPGYRMFLDTRDSQQLKVYAGVGEFINVGSSHVGIQNGFIKVYRPDGSLAATFDNTGASSNLGIIFNSTQESNGPVGINANTADPGYVPGVVQVAAGQAGVWTVVFDYPDYVNTSFSNILNNQPWTRAANQPNSRRVVLAWDVTVTSGGAGNAPAALVHEGRLYSNEHISLINGNGFNTSPIFYVLTDDGYLYQVNINNADPFRFPISSNSLGLVRGDGTPIYKSKPESAFTRSSTPATWLANNLYLFEPQAQDDNSLGLINNKIFFNLPDSNMPTSAQVTDLFRANTHTTWLYNPIQVLNLNNTLIIGANPGGLPCTIGNFQFGKGGYFIFDTNTGGTITLQLDLNNDGDFSDPVDVTLMDVLNNGPDSVFWNGFDGLNNPIQVQDSFEFNYQGSIRYGEIHIALTDVENNNGGVTFQWLNNPSGNVPTQFYYDHSDPGINGPVSGGGTPGNALPTTIPYTYSGNAGNDKYLDQWAFTEYTINKTHVIINIVAECLCQNAEPVLTGAGGGDICAGEDLSLSATNTFPGIGPLTYTWTGPAGYLFIDTPVGVADTSIATVNNINTNNSGTYQVIATTLVGCADTLVYSVNVDPTPNANSILGGGTFCAGADVVLTATNIIPGITTISYVWTGPGIPPGMESGTVGGSDPITLTIPNIQVAAAGNYVLNLTSEAGCSSIPISATVNVNATPVITPVSGGGSYCFDDDITLTATNSAVGISTMQCVWNGPNIVNATQTVNGNSPITLNLNNVNNSFEGTYTLICSVGACSSDPVTFDVVVNANPEINAISPNGDFCAGTSVTLTAFNVNTDTGPIIYTWTGPNNFIFTDTAAQAGPFPVTIPSLSINNSGIYTLNLTTLGGCQAVSQFVTITVNPAPEITISGGGDVCIGQDVTLIATNSTTSSSTVTYFWTGPNGFSTPVATSTGAECILSLDNVDASMSGVYTITKIFTDNNCQATASTTLNVLPGLNITDITPDGEYCEFSTIVLTATNTVDAGNLTYTWNGPNGKVFGPFTVGSFDPLTATILEASPDCSGTWTLNVTSESGCSSNDVTVEITILDGVRIVSTTGGGLYCFNSDVVLNGTGEGSADSVHYTWTDPNGVPIGSGTTTAAGPFPATSGGNVAGDYVLTVVADPSGCSDSDTVNVEFAVQPTVIVLNNDTTLCGLDTLAICGQATTINIGTFTYTWTTPSGDIITGTWSGNTPFCDTILPLQDYGEGAYILVISAAGCTSEPDSFNLNLNPNPTISVTSGGGDFCEGDTIDFCFTNINPEVVGFFYTCILPDGTQITGQTNTNETICLPVSQNGTYCCSIESLDGCVSSLACATFNFVPSADLSVSANTPVCANDTLLLTGTNSLPCTGTITYMWTGPCNFMFQGTAPCGGPFPAVVPNPCPGVYCLIAPLSSTCPDTACVTVVVNPVPMVVGDLITGGGDFCAGEEVVLTAEVTISDNTDITYVWCQNGNPIPGQTGTVPSGTTVTLDLGQVETSDDGEYCLKLTSVNGCTNNPPTCTDVNVNPTPEILTVTGGGTYCEGVDVTLNGTGTPGLDTVTYMWMGPNGQVGGGSAPSQGPFPATIEDIEQIDSGIYTLIVKLGNCADSMSVLVEVNPKPIINVISGNGTFCEGAKVTYAFEIDPNGADTVFWTFTCPNFDTSGFVTSVTEISFMMMVSSTVTCTITAESNDGCEAEPKEITTVIQQITPPVLDVEVNGTPNGGSSNVTVCEGDEMVLTTTSQSGNVVYYWYKDGVLLDSTTTPSFPVDPSMPGSYTVTISVNGCTATSEPVVVTIPEPPVAVDDEYSSITTDPISGNVSDNDTPPENVVVTILQQPTNGTLVVNPDGSFIYTPNDPIAPTDQFTYQICLESCPESCDEATVTITYIIECIVPNVITPNGDEVNDDLQIKCVPEDPNNPSRLRIFNRWGDEVVSFEPYLNSEAWDGTYGTSKKEVPAATYFYLFERDKNSGDKPQAGYIKVSR